MWKHYLSSRSEFGKNKKRTSKDSKKEVLPAKYLEPPGNHMEEAVRKIDITRLVITHDVAVPFGYYEKSICYIVAPARPYMVDRSIRPLPRERPLLHLEIEETTSKIRQALEIDRLPTREKAPLFKEAVEGVRLAAEQDKLYGRFLREEGAKRWLYDMSELIQEKDVLLLCALHRASTRPYVHSMDFQRRNWKNFSTVMMEVSDAVGRCMACNYYYDRAPLQAPLEENLARQPNQGQMEVKSKAQTQHEAVLPIGQDKAKGKAVKERQQPHKKTGDKALVSKGKERARQSKQEGVMVAA